IQLAVRLESLAAGMRNGTGGFLKHRALGWDRPVDPAADHFTRQAVVVALGIETEQRDPEAVLAAGGSVAASGIAACPHEVWHHVKPKAQRRVHGCLRDLHWKADTLAAKFD